MEALDEARDQEQSEETKTTRVRLLIYVVFPSLCSIHDPGFCCMSKQW